MELMASLIAPLVPAVLRHLKGYAEVAGEDAREATEFLARRLLALLIAASCGFVALLMFCAWLVILAWDTDWRAWVAGGLALLFAIAGAVLVAPMLRRGTGERVLFFPRIRYELERDRELIERAVNGRGKHANGGDEHAAG
jgi:uncharacterized membrane protein YqjE